MNADGIIIRSFLSFFYGTINMISILVKMKVMCKCKRDIR